LFVSPPSFLALEPVMVRLAEHPEVCEFEHRSAFADRDDVMHLEPAVTGFVGEGAAGFSCSDDLAEPQSAVGLVPLA